MEEEKKEEIIEEKVEQTPPKKKNKLWIVIVVVCVILLGLTCFFFYNNQKSNKKEEPISNDVDDSTKEETKQDETKKEEIPVSSYEYIPRRELTEEEKKIKSFTYVMGKYFPITNISSIDNSMVLYYAMIDASENFSKESFSTAEMEKTVKDFFGSSFKVTHETISCRNRKGEKTAEEYLYDGNSSYAKTKDSPPYCNVPGRSMAEVKKVSEETKDNLFIQNYKILYTFWYSGDGSTAPPTKFYSHYNDEEPYYESEDFSKAWDYLTEEEREEILKDLPITTFTYEIEADGTKSLKSITVS